MNGGEGFMGENEYLRLWRVEELAEMDAGYEVAEVEPDLFLFGTNGGGEAFAFDTRSTPFSLVAVPFIVIDLCDAIPIATDFRTFLEVLFSSGIPYSSITSAGLG
jgi:hypothetical protein